MMRYTKGFKDGVVLTNQSIVGSKIYTLSLPLIRSFLINNVLFSLGIKTYDHELWWRQSQQKREKEHTFGVLSDWPSATEQLYLGNLYNSEHGIHLGTNSGISNSTVHWMCSKKLGLLSRAMLEEILEWDGLLDEFSNAVSAHTPYFYSTNLRKNSVFWQKNINKKTSITALWKFWIIQLQMIFLANRMYNPQEYNITTPKYTAMKWMLF